MLYWRSTEIGLRFVDAKEFPTSATDDLAAGAELPAGFRALWLRSSQICVQVAGHSIRAEPSDVGGLRGAEELCRFLALAPACYDELRLVAPVAEPSVTLKAEYLTTQDTVMHRVGHSFDNLQALAVALRYFAHDYGLIVSMANAEAFLRVVRVMPWPPKFRRS